MTKRERRYHNERTFWGSLMYSLEHPIPDRIIKDLYWYDFMTNRIIPGERKEVTFTIRPVDHWTGSEQERRNEDAQSAEP